MELITRQTLANQALAGWGKNQRQRRPDVAAKLESLGPTPDPDAVDAVIGNSAWTRVPFCDECGGEVRPHAVVRVGQEPDYESATAHLCRGCVVKALALFLEQPPAPFAVGDSVTLVGHTTPMEVTEVHPDGAVDCGWTTSAANGGHLHHQILQLDSGSLTKLPPQTLAPEVYSRPFERLLALMGTYSPDAKITWEPQDQGARVSVQMPAWASESHATLTISQAADEIAVDMVLVGLWLDVLGKRVARRKPA